MPFDIDVHVTRARIDHLVSLEHRHVLHFKQLPLHSCLQNSEVDGLPLTQFGWIKLGQSILESPEPGEFGVEREATIIADFAIVLVKTESGSLERVSGQIRLHVFLSHPFVFRVLRLGAENRAGERERSEPNETTEIGSHCQSLTTDKIARWALPKFPHERLSHRSRNLGKT